MKTSVAKYIAFKDELILSGRTCGSINNIASTLLIGGSALAHIVKKLKRNGWIFKNDIEVCDVPIEESYRSYGLLLPEEMPHPANKSFLQILGAAQTQGCTIHDFVRELKQTSVSMYTILDWFLNIGIIAKITVISDKQFTNSMRKTVFHLNRFRNIYDCRVEGLSLEIDEYGRYILLSLIDRFLREKGISTAPVSEVARALGISGKVTQILRSYATLKSPVYFVESSVDLANRVTKWFVCLSKTQPSQIDYSDNASDDEEDLDGVDCFTALPLFELGANLIRRSCGGMTPMQLRSRIGFGKKKIAKVARDYIGLFKCKSEKIQDGKLITFRMTWKTDDNSSSHENLDKDILGNSDLKQRLKDASEVSLTRNAFIVKTIAESGGVCIDSYVLSCLRSFEQKEAAGSVVHTIDKKTFLKILSRMSSSGEVILKTFPTLEGTKLYRKTIANMVYLPGVCDLEAKIQRILQGRRLVEVDDIVESEAISSDSRMLSTAITDTNIFISGRKRKRDCGVDFSRVDSIPLSVSVTEVSEKKKQAIEETRARFSLISPEDDVIRDSQRLIDIRAHCNISRRFNTSSIVIDEDGLWTGRQDALLLDFCFHEYFVNKRPAALLPNCRFDVSEILDCVDLHLATIPLVSRSLHSLCPVNLQSCQITQAIVSVVGASSKAIKKRVRFLQSSLPFRRALSLIIAYIGFDDSMLFSSFGNQLKNLFSRDISCNGKVDARSRVMQSYLSDISFSYSYEDRDDPSIVRKALIELFAMGSLESKGEGCLQISPSVWDNMTRCQWHDTFATFLHCDLSDLFESFLSSLFNEFLTKFGKLVDPGVLDSRASFGVAHSLFGTHSECLLRAEIDVTKVESDAQHKCDDFDIFVGTSSDSSTIHSRHLNKVSLRMCYRKSSFQNEKRAVADTLTFGLLNPWLKVDGHINVQLFACIKVKIASVLVDYPGASARMIQASVPNFSLTEVIAFLNILEEADFISSRRSIFTVDLKSPWDSVLPLNAQNDLSYFLSI